MIARQRRLQLLRANGECVSDQREILGMTVEGHEKTEQLPEVADSAAVDPLQNLSGDGILKGPCPDRHLEPWLEDLGEMSGQAAIPIGKIGADPAGFDEPAGQTLLPRLEKIVGELLAAGKVVVEGALGHAETTGQPVDGEGAGAGGLEQAESHLEPVVPGQSQSRHGSKAYHTRWYAEPRFRPRNRSRRHLLYFDYDIYSPVDLGRYLSFS